MGKKESIKKNNIKKKKNKIKKFFAIILFWLLILTILTLIAFGGYFVITSDKLKTKNVSVEKTEYYTKEQVLEVAKIKNEQHMIFFSRSKLKNKILKELPYIEDLKIKIGKDSTLRIIVQERKAKYVINNKDTNEYVRVDKHGIMLEKVKAENILPEELPMFGLSLDKDETVGKNIPKTEMNKIERFEEVYKMYMTSNMDNKITSVKFENSKIILTLDYKTEVVIESCKNLEYKMRFLKEILKEVSGKGGRIDLTLDSPTFVEKVG